MYTHHCSPATGAAERVAEDAAPITLAETIPLLQMAMPEFEQSMDLTIYGQVISGQGTAALELAGLQSELTEIDGAPLFPGSLNLLLRNPVRFRDELGFSFDHEQGYIWRASLNGIDVWIYRWRHAPLHVAEILCRVNLRERLKLHNGDFVLLRVSADKLEKVSLFDRLIWTVVWIGRRQASYKEYVYDEAYERSSIEFGIAQQQPIERKPIRSILWAMKQILKRASFDRPKS
jgi:CTP-dependent riboflavin kinase